MLPQQVNPAKMAMLFRKEFELCKGPYDVPMRDCTVTLDVDVVDHGTFVDKKMMVERVER